MCVCVCPSGKRNKLRVYYLSWLRNKILHNDPEVEKKQGWTTVGDMEGCGHYRVGEVTRVARVHLFLRRKKRGPGTPQKALKPETGTWGGVR